MTDDDLRDKLIEAAARDMYQRDDLFDSEHKFWRDTVTPTIDALMPVVRKALAAAWDEGAEEAYEWQIGVAGKPDNPWREGQ